MLFAALLGSARGTTRTWRGGPTTSAVGGTTDMPFKRANICRVQGRFSVAELFLLSPRCWPIFNPQWLSLILAVA
jgi:hypothetical protein